jgi:zinc/manganese transport system permease protein
VNNVVTFLAAPTAMCLILAVIHCYLGLHVLARGVIFVDLSLAQVASFGATLALIWTGDHDSSLGYFVSLGATFVAAALFALARKFEHRFSQEAVIGIVYALASAAVVLVVDRLAHGAEHLKEALVGQILWVGWPEVIKTLIIYSVVGAIHFVFRKQFLRASSHDGEGHWFWDFLFYALFGVVITSSTHIAGVLMVFSFLIVPSILGQVFFKTIKARLLFGWSLSSVLSILGMYASYKLDVPVGALIVVMFSSLPVLVLLWFGLVSVLKGHNGSSETSKTA